MRENQLPSRSDSGPNGVVDDADRRQDLVQEGLVGRVETVERRKLDTTRRVRRVNPS